MKSEFNEQNWKAIELLLGIEEKRRSEIIRDCGVEIIKKMVLQIERLTEPQTQPQKDHHHQNKNYNDKYENKNKEKLCLLKSNSIKSLTALDFKPIGILAVQNSITSSAPTPALTTISANKTNDTKNLPEEKLVP